MESVITQLGVNDWLVDQGVIRYKDNKEAFAYQEIQKQGVDKMMQTTLSNPFYKSCF